MESKKEALTRRLSWCMVRGYHREEAFEVAKLMEREHRYALEAARDLLLKCAELYIDDMCPNDAQWAHMFCKSVAVKIDDLGGDDDSKT